MTDEHKTEVVAEISGNHGGVLNNARALIKEAKDAGAHAVKFQCFSPERLALKRFRPEVLALAGDEPLFDLYRRTHTPWHWFPDLIEQCRYVGIPWFSSVFDPADVAFLETLNCPRYKISAFEMLDWELIRAVQETGKPIVMSVRPMPGVTVLHATNYDGTISALGLSDHGSRTVPHGLPMIEWHLRLPGVETPDSDFSLTPSELAYKIAALAV